MFNDYSSLEAIILKFKKGYNLSKKKNIKKWAWVLTGSGHFFNETIDLINKLKDVDIFVSKAAEEVLVMYKKKGKISKEIKIYKTILLVQPR